MEPVERGIARGARTALVLLTLCGLPLGSLAQEAAAPAARAHGKLMVSPAEYFECANEFAFVRGESVLVTGGDFLPNEPVEVVLQQDSGDVPVAVVHATARGGLSARVAIPASAATEGDVRLLASAEKGAGGGGVTLRSPPLQIFPDRRDSDGDHVEDRCDTCPTLASDNLEDSDGDGLGDPCDKCPNDSDNDSDADGLCADVDPNPYAPEAAAQ